MGTLALGFRGSRSSEGKADRNICAENVASKDKWDIIDAVLAGCVTPCLLIAADSAAAVAATAAEDLPSSGSRTEEERRSLVSELTREAMAVLYNCLEVSIPVVKGEWSGCW